MSVIKFIPEQKFNLIKTCFVLKFQNFQNAFASAFMHTLTHKIHQIKLIFGKSHQFIYKATLYTHCSE